LGRGSWAFIRAIALCPEAEEHVFNLPQLA
jgi:hypothetical protein